MKEKVFIKRILDDGTEQTHEYDPECKAFADIRRHNGLRKHQKETQQQRTITTEAGHYKKSFSKSHKQALSELSPVEYFVLNYIEHSCEWSNQHSCIQNEICDFLKLSRRTVQRAIYVLQEKKYIDVIIEKGKQNTYTISPFYSFQGEPKQQILEFKKWNKGDNDNANSQK